jgi:3-oxoacyl-[acyl-carrier-protein] synthase-3
VFRRYYGLDEVPRDPGGVLDLLLGAVGNLPELRGNERRVRYVLWARSFAVVAPYPENPLAQLCRRAGLGHATAFAVTHQACASGLLALDLAGRLLANDPTALALVLAGEKAFTPETTVVPQTSVFGEGASACLVSHDGPRNRLLSFAADQRGRYDLDDTGFADDYPEALAAAIEAAVDRAGLRLDDIARIVPHSVNAVAWQRTCRRLGYPIARVVLDNLPVTGHVYCADAFLNLARADLRPGQAYVLAAAGAARGATFSAMVFAH